MKQRGIVAFAWALSLVVSVLAVVVWWDLLESYDSQLNSYMLFPLFGLLAFSIMWAHYVVGAGRRLAGVEKAPLKAYFRVTGWLALLFILLHPSLLIFQLWRDGAGLPPQSYIDYVGQNLKWAVALGTLSFLIFLSFETKRWFEKKNWWAVVEYAQVLALFAIVVHGLALGSNLQSGWYRAVWLWYAALLFVSVGYIYVRQAIKAHREGKLMKKVIAIAIVLALVLGGGILAYQQFNKDDEPAPVTTSVDEQNLATEVADQEVYAAEEVADHNSANDCWTMISGSVYDITSYIPRHPGGDEILAACGADGTTLFTQRQDSSGESVGSGTPHSSSARSQLEQFKIGTVAQ